ncbi:MAG: helix-turn-helix domain-containing protein [Sedimentisphaerales bacterium]|jgi:excisionase family DNA binding protein
MNMKKQEYLTIPQAAKLLGISRIAVYQKVKKGQIKAHKIGRNYVIRRDVIGGVKGKPLSASEGRRVDAAVRKAMKEYGETFRLLGQE